MESEKNGLREVEKMESEKNELREYLINDNFPEILIDLFEECLIDGLLIIKR